MSDDLLAVDHKVKREIERRRNQDLDFWTFRTRSRRTSEGSLFQYPAMMVPQMQYELLDIITSCQSGVECILDPFVGSGTVISEGMRRGLNVLGQDVNPLAVLLSKVVIGPFVSPEELQARVSEVVALAEHDRGLRLETELPSVGKWFTLDAARDLSRLRRAIHMESNLWVRRFLWATLAETIRQTSNSRPSTFKLHIRPDTEIRALPRPLGVFRNVLKRNVGHFSGYYWQLIELGRLTGNAYKGFASAALADSSVGIRRLSNEIPRKGYDMVLTSPPYGDNLSTVTYGQYSYLPLWWIDEDDIDHGLDLHQYLRTTQELDRISLGGKSPGDVGEVEQMLTEKSPAFRGIAKELADAPPDRLTRVIRFSGDLDRSIGIIVAAAKKNAYMVWTVGNRRVGGVEVPTDAILTELMSHYNAVLVHKVSRLILSKRMAHRNNIAPTMKDENVLIFRLRATTQRGAV